MNQKDELLSIGEMAKLTGAGIQALRYYERKNILKPAYTDPDSGYRYYSYDQIYFVQLIINCVNLDIPLNGLMGILDTDNMEGLREFFKRNKEIAERKAEVIKQSIDAFNSVLNKMEIGKLYNDGQTYSREFSEKTYHIKPCGQYPKNAGWLKPLTELAYELHGENYNRITAEDNIDELIPTAEFGFISQHSPKGVCSYFFAEISKQTASDSKITVPAGTYFFRQDKISKIENAPEIFKEHIADKNTYMFIETEESFFSETKISQPMYELRMITL